MYRFREKQTDVQEKKKKKKIKNYLSSALAAMRRGEAYIGKVLIQREVVRKCSHVLLQKLLLWWIGCLLTVFSASFESCMSVLKHFLESSLGLQSPLVVFFFWMNTLIRRLWSRKASGLSWKQELQHWLPARRCGDSWLQCGCLEMK